MWRQRRRILNRKTEWAIKMADNKTVIFHNKITEVLMSLLFVQGCTYKHRYRDAVSFSLLHKIWVWNWYLTGDDGDGHGQPE